MTAILIVVAPTFAEAQAAMAGRTDVTWYWASSFSVARRWIERAEARGVDVSATILVAGMELRRAA